jgi:uncharacterized protein YgiB involved in biofilm formation
MDALELLSLDPPPSDPSKHEATSNSASAAVSAWGRPSSMRSGRNASLISSTVDAAVVVVVMVTVTVTVVGRGAGGGARSLLGYFGI